MKAELLRLVQDAQFVSPEDVNVKVKFSAGISEGKGTQKIGTVIVEYPDYMGRMFKQSSYGTEETFEELTDKACASMIVQIFALGLQKLHEPINPESIDFSTLIKKSELYPILGHIEKCIAKLEHLQDNQEAKTAAAEKTIVKSLDHYLDLIKTMTGFNSHEKED